MGCCGSKQAQPVTRSNPGGHHAAPAGVLARDPATPGGVVLRYRERAPVLVRGPVTGLPYAFSSGQPTQSVDARDAQALLRTRLFTRG
jgi:hypothetical protein